MKIHRVLILAADLVSYTSGFEAVGTYLILHYCEGGYSSQNRGFTSDIFVALRQLAANFLTLVMASLDNLRTTCGIDLSCLLVHGKNPENLVPGSGVVSS